MSCHHLALILPAVLSSLLRLMFLAALAVPRCSESANLLSLEDAVRLAVAEAPALEARDAGVIAASEEAERADALPDPTLIAGIDNLTATGPDALDFDADLMTMKRIGLRQLIPARAKREARRRYAVRRIDEAQAELRSGTLDVRRAAALAWIELWAAELELRALDSVLKQAATTAEIAAARFSGGAANAESALATRAALLEVENRIDVATADRIAAQAMLARWTVEGRNANAAEPPDFTRLRVSEGRLLAEIDRLGPLLPVAARVDVAAANVALARAEKRSDWSISASYGQRERRTDMVMVEFGIDLPVFGRNRQDRGIAAREADLGAALATREDLRRDAIATVRVEVAKWSGLKRQLRRYDRDLLPLASDRSAAALAGYGGGGSLQDWLDAHSAELEIRVAHVRLRADLARAWAGLAYLLPSEIER